MNKPTGKDKFEATIRIAIHNEERRRKIGRTYVLRHVVRICNSLREPTGRWVEEYKVQYGKGGGDE